MHLWWNFWSNWNRVWRTIFWCQKELWFLTSVFRSIFQNDSVALRRARFWLVLVNNEMQPASGSPIIFWSVTTWVNYQRAIYNARPSDFPWCSLFFNQIKSNLGGALLAFSRGGGLDDMLKLRFSQVKFWWKMLKWQSSAAVVYFWNRKA